MRDRGIATLITTTPSLRGRSFGTNLIEAAAAGLTGLPPEQLHLPTLLECFRSLGWDQPRIESLT